MNEYDRRIAAAAQRKAEAERAKAEEAQTRDEANRARLAAVHAVLESQAKPEFLIAKDALDRAGFKTTVELAEVRENQYDFGCVRLKIASTTGEGDRVAEIRGRDPEHELACRFISPRSETNKGSIGCGSDVRDFARQILGDFIDFVHSQNP